MNMIRHRDLSTLHHLLALYSKRNYCIHVHVYLFVKYTFAFPLVKLLCIFKHFGVMSIYLDKQQF